MDEADVKTPGRIRKRRIGKEISERVVAAVLLVVTSPIFLLAAAAILLEGLISPRARGPIFLREARVSRGERFDLIKFRTLTREAFESSLATGYVALEEMRNRYTRVGKLLHQWYLDELPQLWNIVRGDMFLIGTRPWPVEIYERELAKGDTLKRDMPAGLIGPVQGTKGHRDRPSQELDAEYWEAFQTYPAWKLLLLDLKIVLKSLRVQLEHKGL